MRRASSMRRAMLLSVDRPAQNLLLACLALGGCAGSVPGGTDLASRDAAPDACTATLDALGCAPTYEGGLAAAVATCNDYGDPSSGKCAQYLLVLGGPGFGGYCLYDGATRVLVAGEVQSDINSFCGNTSSSIYAGPMIDLVSLCDSSGLPHLCKGDAAVSDASAGE
jgi:hypothetical protein